MVCSTKMPIPLGFTLFKIHLDHNGDCVHADKGHSAAFLFYSCAHFIDLSFTGFFFFSLSSKVVKVLFIVLLFFSCAGSLVTQLCAYIDTCVYTALSDCTLPLQRVHF